MPRLSLLSSLIQQLVDGRAFFRLILIPSFRQVSFRWDFFYLSRRHVLHSYRWHRVEPGREICLLVNRLCVCPDDRRRLLMPFIPELRPFAYRQVQDLWLWITARGRVPPHVDVISVLLFGCLDAFVVFITQRLFNVQDLAPFEQLLYCPLFEVLHRHSA